MPWLTYGKHQALRDSLSEVLISEALSVQEENCCCMWSRAVFMLTNRCK